MHEHTIAYAHNFSQQYKKILLRLLQKFGEKWRSLLRKFLRFRMGLRLSVSVTVA